MLINNIVYLNSPSSPDLDTQKTESVRCHRDGSNRLKNAMGVAVDPAGNVLVSSQYHGRIELFARDGNYVKTLSCKLEVIKKNNTGKRMQFRII